ncbi:MAG: hypothetical protein VB081_10400, partial [Christensenella sp.]|uniref:hypothetical protein n=1 Tax=Christensenella sp. TaxID=1935934 RepID=UPI002B208707
TLSTPSRFAISCFKASDINPGLDIINPPLHSAVFYRIVNMPNDENKYFCKKDLSCFSASRSFFRNGRACRKRKPTK